MKKLISAIIALTLTLCMGINVFAYNYLGGTLYSGISGIKYYVSNSTKPADDYASIISSAWSSWKSATGTISYSKVSTNSSSVVDFYADRVTSGVEATYTSWTTLHNFTGDDWRYAYIYINRKWFDNQSTKVNKGCVAHEIGHALGLDENNNNQNSIMCQSSYGRKVEVPQTIDADAINTLY